MELNPSQHMAGGTETQQTIILLKHQVLHLASVLS